MTSLGVKIGAALVALVGVAIVALTFQRPPLQALQHGYRGTGMDLVYHPSSVAATLANNAVPKPEDKQDPANQPSSKVYQNVKVLQTVDANEFLRLMAAMTTWVAPKQGCNYCHNVANLADDSLYTKRVARRMIQMVQHLNADWKPHLLNAGVTCYTCHRGNPVPKNIWFNQAPPPHSNGLVEAWVGKNHPAVAAGYASLPSDPFTPFLEKDDNIRVVATEALPGGDRSSIKQTEWTYALMMHFATSLGVNCTFCHNTRAVAEWDQSTPQRVNAWYGIRMVRDLNDAYLNPLQATFPSYRKGAEGDAPKVNCATCHQGVYRPLYGANMVNDYPELLSSTEEPAKTGMR